MKTGSKKQAQNIDKSSQADKSTQATQLVQQELAFDAPESESEPESKKQAIHYGELEIIPGVVGDCYILNDSRCVMSENGFARLLGIDSKLLNRIRTNWPPKTLEPFCNKGLNMSVTLATVTAKNCPYKNQDIVVYDVPTMEEIIRAYAMAYVNGGLRQNQLHIGRTCADLLTALLKSSLLIRIECSCGFELRPQETVQRFHWNTIYKRAINLLYAALKRAYPKRKAERYSQLLSTCFGYVYKQFLGNKLYQEIKKCRNKSYPIHQYIEDEVIRSRCVCYLVMLANVIADSECRVVEAKIRGLAATESLIAVKTPGLLTDNVSGEATREIAVMLNGDAPSEIVAVYYGEVNICGKIVDGYILQDGQAGLSENGLAILLETNRQSLNSISLKGLPQNLRQFLEPGEQLEAQVVKVTAANSRYRGRCINFYPVAAIELLLRVYAFALLAGKLQKNQRQIGRNCLHLVISLTRFAFEMLIIEACGLKAKLREAMQRQFRRGLLDDERNLLFGAAGIANPAASPEKRRAIVAQAFRIAYRDALSAEERRAIKSKKSPLHQHIQDVEVRNKLSRCLLLIAGQMILCGSTLKQARHRAGELGKNLDIALTWVPDSDEKKKKENGPVT